MKHKGITLIELIVVMAIMSIFSLGVYNYSSSQLNIYKIQNTETQLQYDVKNAANQIASDIKRSRFTSYSVETNYNVKDDSGAIVDGNQLSTGKFSTIIDSLGSSYKPLVYIDQIGGKSCMYFWKTSTKQIVKLDLTSNEFTLGNSTQIYNYNINDYNNVNKFNDNNGYKASIIDGLTDKPDNMNNDTVPLIYEEYGTYYLIYENGSDYYQYTLLPQSNVVTANGSSEKVIVNNVENVTVASVDLNSDSTLADNAQNNAFNITITLKKSILVNGSPRDITRSFTTCASRELYDGGDTNEKSN